VIAALVIPAFDLRAALRLRPALETEPAALAPLPGSEPLIGSVTAAAQARGVRPGMRLGEALATCPALVLVDQDPASVEQTWEEVLCRLEDAGFAVESEQAGTVLFQTDGVERLYGGLEPALKRALAAVGPAWDARAGAAERRFAALAAASVARPGQMLIVSDDRTRRFLAPLPLTLLPLERERYEELEELGVRTIGELAGLPGGAVADRFGPDGRRAWGLARGEQDGRVAPRQPRHPLVETLEFPDAVGQELTLRRGVGVLVDRMLDRPERAGRPPRKLALWARLVGGASWRRTVTLREPTADPARLRLALGPKLAELPAPVLKLRLEAVELAEDCGEQLELLRAEGEARKGRLQQGLRQVRAAVGSGGISMVVEVAPWSRIPEARTLLVPRDD
jgi:protein ImuB